MARYGNNHAGGRPPGSRNATSLQVQAFCRSVCEDPQYRDSILERARHNNLGSMEPTVWAYAYGKPKESVDLRLGRIDDDGLSSLSMEELTLRAMHVVTELQEAREAERQLAEYAAAHPEVLEVEAVPAQTEPLPYAPFSLVKRERCSDV